MSSHCEVVGGMSRMSIRSGASNNTIACGVCSVPINPANEMVRSVEGVSMHSRCFKCVVCLEPFADGTFYPLNGEPYCERDFKALFSSKCAACLEVITGKSITAADCKYHPECFNCPACQKSLVGETFILSKGIPMCKPCYRSRLHNRNVKGRDSCVKCSRPFKIDDHVTYKMKRYCPHHFNCKMCRIVLTKSAREHKEELYCTLCYEKVKVKYCFACKLPIEGRVLTALGKSWHPEHFLCCVCNMSFKHDPFFEHKGQAYCEVHYHRLFGKVCFKTQAPMKSGEIAALHNVWGKESFDCFGCGANLSEKSKFTGMDGRPFCAKCSDLFEKNIRASIHRCQASRENLDKRADKLKRDMKRQESTS